MRMESAYIFDCAGCEAHIESHERTGTCKGCGVVWEIGTPVEDWSPENKKDQGWRLAGIDYEDFRRDKYPMITAESERPAWSPRSISRVKLPRR